MNFTERHTPTLPSLRLLEGPDSGPLLVQLHGVARRAEDFQPVWDALASRHRIISVDQRGHGKSDRTGSYLVVDYVADAAALLRDVLAEPAILFGHSLGAMVAAGVAAELPELVRAVVLEDPPFNTMGSNIEGTAWQAQFAGMRETASHGGSIEQMIDRLADIRLPQRGGGFKLLGELRDRTALRRSAEGLALMDPQVLTPAIEGRWLDGYDIPGRLSRVRCPVLLMQADPRAGGALTDADAQLCLESMTQCQIVHFPGAGHLLHWLEPARVAELVHVHGLSC